MRGPLIPASGFLALSEEEVTRVEEDKTGVDLQMAVPLVCLEALAELGACKGPVLAFPAAVLVESIHEDLEYAQQVAARMDGVLDSIRVTRVNTGGVSNGVPAPVSIEVFLTSDQVDRCSWWRQAQQGRDVRLAMRL